MWLSSVNPATHSSKSPKPKVKNEESLDLEKIRKKIIPWLNYNYTTLLKKEKKTLSFNKTICQKLLDSFKVCPFPIPNKEIISDSGYRFLIEKMENKIPGLKKWKVFSSLTDKKLNLTNLIYQIQFNGILWQSITDRFKYIKAELNKYLAKKKQRTQWTNTFSFLLDGLINISTNPNKDPSKKRYYNQITPLILLIDHLNNGLDHSNIQKIMTCAAGGELGLEEVKATLQKWKEVKHIWKQTEKPAYPIDKIKLKDCIESFSRKNKFLPKELIIQNKNIDMTSLLFSDSDFRNEIFSRLSEWENLQPKDPTDQMLKQLANCLKKGLPTNLFCKVNQKKPLFLIDWCSVFGKRNNDIVSPSKHRFQQIMDFASISKRDLFSEERHEIIKKCVTKELEKARSIGIEFNDLKMQEEIHSQKLIISQLHDFLRKHCSLLMTEKRFNHFLFTHLCQEIYKAGFESNPTDISEIVNKLLNLEDDTPSMQRLWTLLRFCSNGCFGKATLYSRQLVPGLFRDPYYAKPKGEDGVSLQIQFQEQSFTVTQRRPHYFYPRKNPGRGNSEVDEKNYYAKILFVWTMTDYGNLQPEKNGWPYRTATLEFPSVSFAKEIPIDIIKYILKSLIEYEDLIETDEVALEDLKGQNSG